MSAPFIAYIIAVCVALAGMVTYYVTGRLRYLATFVVFAVIAFSLVILRFKAVI